MERTRSFWGWGFDDAALSTEELDALGTRVSAVIAGPFNVVDPPSSDEIRLRASRIEVPASLESICRSDDVARASHTYGKSFVDIVRALERRWERPPDVVATPANEDEIVAILEWAEAIDAVVIPYGGGSSVVGGVEAPANDERRIISCDLARLDRVLEVDVTSRAAHIEGGVFGPSLEDQLRGYGLTMRHYPQSFEMSTLGGWIATRSGGHFATMHTHIDDFVESVRALTPAGVWESRRLPGSGAGPSPERLMVGSEGILGIISSAWMRLQDRPTFRASTVARFNSFEAGAQGARALAHSGLWPSNCRLLDAGEALMTGAGDGTAHLLLVGFESADHPVDASLTRAVEIIQQCGGVASEPRGGARRSEQPSDDSAERWRSSFLRAPYLRDGLLRLGFISETFETAITWDRFDGFVHDVRAATSEALHAVGADGAIITCRLTHVYPDGAAPYFTVLAPGRVNDRVAQWREVKSAVMSAISNGGGTATHHHAIGRDHRAGYDLERPELFAAQLRAAKAVVDPHGLLNPGVLIDP